MPNYCISDSSVQPLSTHIVTTDLLGDKWQVNHVEQYSLSLLAGRLDYGRNNHVNVKIMNISWNFLTFE